jgi:ElaB/YqjD/DUF883 family membrane-anchored ribosome-binding protein
MNQTSRIHPFVVWSKNRLDEMEAAVLEAENDANRVEQHIKAEITATLAKAKQTRDSFKATMQASIEELERKGEGAIKSAKQQLERDWQEFEKAMDAAVVQLNNAGKEFEARAAAQLHSWQETIQKCNKVAAGIAVEQKESFNASVKRMQERAQQGKDHFAEVRRAASTSSEGYRRALRKSREAFDEAYESAKSAFAKV